MKQSTKQKIEALCTHYPTKRAALLPALWLVHDDEGWISPEAGEEVAALLEITSAEVREVTSFYTMFARKQLGKHHIQVCTGVCCRLRGSDHIVAHLCEQLDIKVNRSTKDGLFHLSMVECLGSCGTAPMMQIDHDYYEDLTTDKVDAILEKLKKN